MCFNVVSAYMGGEWAVLLLNSIYPTKSSECNVGYSLLSCWFIVVVSDTSQHFALTRTYHEFEGQTPCPEDTSYMCHRTQKNQADTDLEAFFIVISFFINRR